MPTLANPTEQLAVIAYPKLSYRDRQWIDDTRNKHDDHASLIAPHITLVFPWRARQADTELRHVRTVCARHAAISLRLSRVTSYRDRLSPISYAFLVPTEGGDALCALHDELHTGPLAAQRIADIAFVPHVRLANFADASACQQLVGSLEQATRDIAVELHTLTIARLLSDAGRVQMVIDDERVALANRARR